MFRHGGKPLAHMRAGALRIGLAALLTGCGVQASASTAAPTPMVAPAPSATAGRPVATSAVAIRNFAFSPPAITVPVGTTVTWTNDDVEQHTATANDKSFDSDALNNGKSYSFTFSKAGTFAYSCLIHPDMLGQVIVTAR
jgi:plastocyanin